MPNQRRQPTFTDTYTDLPTWVRFGARLLEANTSGYESTFEPRTVVHITKTQIVCVEGHDPDNSDAIEIRYRRSTCRRIAPGTKNDGNVLADPHAQGVRDVLAAQTLDRLYYDLARLHREQITHASREDRPRTVDAVLDKLDHLAAMIAEATNAIRVRDAQAAAADMARAQRIVEAGA